MIFDEVTLKWIFLMKWDKKTFGKVKFDVLTLCHQINRVLNQYYLTVIGRTKLVSFEAKNLNIASIDLSPPLVGSVTSKKI